MKLIITYQGLIRLTVNKVESMKQLQNQVRMNIRELKNDQWMFEYVDEDGDKIVMSTEEDLQVMLTATQVDSLQASIILCDSFVNSQSIPSSLCKSEAVESSMANFIQDSSVETDPYIPKTTNIDEMQLEKKVAKLVDQRLQELLPSIIADLQKQKQELIKYIQNEKIKPLNKIETIAKNKIIQPFTHPIKCSQCQNYPIIGLRYRCQKCFGYNLCQKCFKIIDHSHNFTKIQNNQQINNNNKNIFLNNKNQFIWKKNNLQQNQKQIIFPQFTHLSPSNPINLIYRPPSSQFPFNNFFQKPLSFTNNSTHEFQQKPNAFLQFFNTKNSNNIAPPIFTDNLKNDQKLIITEKCFKMSSLLGGKPQAYQQFVKNHISLQIMTMIKKYKSQNLLEIEKAYKQKQRIMILQQLKFYYKTDESKYLKIFNQNPNKSFHELIKIINKQKSQFNFGQKWFSVPISIQQQQKQQKRKKILANFCDIFGPDNIGQYKQFIEIYQQQDPEKIIHLYFSNKTKQPN